MKIELKEEEINRLADLILYEHSDYEKDFNQIDTDILAKIDGILDTLKPRGILS